MSEETTPETPELSPVEQEAVAHGWKPKEQFDDSTGKKWRTADEFMDRKPLFDKIDEQHRKLKDLEKGLNALSEHNKRIEQSAYDRALTALRSERKEALEEGDLVKAEELRDRMDEIKEQVRQVPQTKQPDPYFETWVEKNTWYTQDRDMKAYADGLAAQLISEGVTDPSVGLPQVERKVREMFPTKFRNPNKDLPGLESGKGKVKPDGFRLTEMEERVINQMLKAKAPITREEYVAQIKKSRGVE